MLTGAADVKAAAPSALTFVAGRAHWYNVVIRTPCPVFRRHRRPGGAVHGDRMNATFLEKRYLLHSTAVSFGGLFINQTLQTAGGVVMARLIASPALFGQINVMLQILGMSGLFLNAGLNSAATFFVARHGAKAIRTVYGPALAGSLAVGALAVAALSLFAAPIAAVYHVPALSSGLIVGSFTLLTNSLINVGIAVFSGMRRFAVQAYLMVTTTLMSVLGMVVGVLLAPQDPSGLAVIAGAMSAANVVTCAVVLLAVHFIYRAPLLVPLTAHRMWRMLRYGAPIYAGNIAKAFQQSFLVIVTGATSIVDAGYLSNAMKLAGYLNIITWAFNIVALPFLSEAAHSEGDARRRATLCFRYNNFILLPLTLFICIYPHAMITALFGSHYATVPSVVYLRLMAVGVLFSSVSRLGGMLLAGVGRTRANFWTMIVSGALVFFVAPLAVRHAPTLGTLVFAVGWALSAASLFWFLLRDGLPLDWRRAFVEPLLPTAVMAIILETGALVPHGSIPAAVLGLATAAVGTWLLERPRAETAATA